MIREGNAPDSHATWLNDIEYREEYGSEAAKLNMAASLLLGREAMDLTQSRLAKRAGTSQAYIAKLERGDANPTIGNVGRLFACMWLKPSIVPAPLVPSQSIESALLKILSEPEARFDLSQFKAKPSAPEPILDLITRPSSDVFSDLVDGGQLIVVWCYDNATRTWSSYDPAAPAEINDLQYVSTGDIVWIEVTENTVFQGTTLLQGWNLLSLK